MKLELGLASELVLQQSLQIRRLVGGKSAGGGDLGRDLAPVLGEKLLEGSDHAAQREQTPLFSQQQDQLARERGCASPGQHALHALRLVLAREQRRADEAIELRAVFEQLL